MFRIEVGDKKEVVFFGIVLACLLFLVISATQFDWPSNKTDHAYGQRHTFSPVFKGEPDVSSLEKNGDLMRTATPSQTPNHHEPDRGMSWFFFGPVIFALLLLFCLTSRYHTRREVREMERQWKNTCENFLTRLESERLKPGERHSTGDSVWSKILKNGL
jgi:hypothetical protein